VETGITVVDRPREPDRRLARLHAAAVGADVDLHQHVERHARRARSFVEVGDVTLIIGAYRDARALRERREAPEFRRADHLVGDQHVGNAAINHRLGLAGLLAAHAHRAARNLPLCDIRALVALRVRPQPDSFARERRVHAVEVALERIEVEDQRRRIHFRQGHADSSGKISAHE